MRKRLPSYLLFSNLKGNAHLRQSDRRDPETEPLAFADLVAIDAMKLFFFLVNVELVSLVIYLRRP